MNLKPEFLVVDTTAFIQNTPLQEMGMHILTIQEVVDEITSKRQLRRLVVLPYDLKIVDVSTENVTFVTEFSKKTGDYPSLSATDIKLMALVYQLEKEHVGLHHLHSTPTKNRAVTMDPPKLAVADVVGFYKGEDSKLETSNEASEEKGLKTNINFKSVNVNGEDKKNRLESKIGVNKCNTLVEELDLLRINQVSLDSGETDKDLAVVDFSELSATDVLQTLSDEEYESDRDDADNCDWITPENVKQVKQQMDFGLTEDKHVTVACVTTDFAMQNVMKQIGLNIVGLDGRVIKHIRTFIFRCYACFKTTSDMTKVFCPKCGNKTLKKVAVSVDENGQQKIHINPRKPLTARGKKFSLPKPQGGKHANNPILVADQPVPDQQPTRLARTKTNALDNDYISGFSPFAMKDVNSKSAMLGIQGKNHQVKYWMRKNPNEVVKHCRKKK